ncbi:MAG: nucleoside triphosphate pyrophosphohydrolase [Candidatus Methanomethylophilaceae archaeon]|nr:nucleoside triphosphate pyrophosphohydrolase [Candidatus Methanomethylophilaceae archaeon]
MEYDKLVRDRIPEIIAENGGSCEIERVKGKEYSRYLCKKLGEKVDEFRIEHNAEDLADILEVVFALAADIGVEECQLIDIRNKKRSNRGGFEQGIVLKKTFF